MLSKIYHTYTVYDGVNSLRRASLVLSKHKRSLVVNVSTCVLGPQMITVSKKIYINVYSNKKLMHETQTHTTESQKKVFFNRSNASFVGEPIIKTFFFSLL